MEAKPRISMPIVVEGRYDKNTLKQIFDATVISVDGFGIFNSKEKQALLRRLSVDGVILLTDPDGGGKQIRSFLNGIIPKDRIFNAYVPKLKGKERRKTSPSRAGLLGVEGMSREVLMRALAPFINNGERATDFECEVDKMITKVDFFKNGLTGVPGASERRVKLSRHFDLPDDMTPNALLEALNILTDIEGYKAAVAELFSEETSES